MKLKKSSLDQASGAAAAPGGAVIASRFRLDADPRAAAAKTSAAPGKGGVIASFCCALIAVILLSVAGALMLANWQAIARS